MIGTIAVDGWAVTFGTARTGLGEASVPPSLLLAVPNVTAHPSTAIVPTSYYLMWMAVWLSGNTLALINVVALRQTRLVLGWVTVCGRVNHLGM